MNTYRYWYWDCSDCNYRRIRYGAKRSATTI